MFRLLLSLLLVFSQQMGYAHALTHATAISEATTTLEQQASLAADSLSDEALADPHLSGITKLGVAHSCAQCLSVAQCVAIANTQFSAFPIADGVAVFGAIAPALAHSAGTASAYQSRAPPPLFC